MDLSGIEWRKSSYSSSNGGQCVEVGAHRVNAGAGPQHVAVRDSKNPDGPALVFTQGAWDAFIGHIKTGRPGQA
jgi:Domain of unknown function (DUF397)